MTIKVLMRPHLAELQGESGVNRVIEAYFEHMPEFDIEMVKPSSNKHDLVAAHAGVTGAECDICHCHGLYWTGDVSTAEWEWRVNARVIDACRNAKYITVPSEWVAETFRRDMRLNPFVVPHGIDWSDWQDKTGNEGYVLWNKNRRGVDVVDNSIMDILMRRFPDVPFVSTFITPGLEGMLFEMWPKNFKIIEAGGKTPHAEMKRFVQRAGVYLSVAKETFGLGTLEAMASGVPVLGWDWGGNSQLVQHGVNGYLAKVGNVDDLCEGLVYCLKHRKILGDNGREMARAWTWQRACEMVAGVYRLAVEDEIETISVVIPVYNKSNEQVGRAVDSVLSQTHKASEIIVVNDGSKDKVSLPTMILNYQDKYPEVKYLYQSNQGVANARNTGIFHCNSTFVCCLDSDDWLESSFIDTCIKELNADRSLGIAYTGLRFYNADGSNGVSNWPSLFNPDKQLSYPKQNQIPTCCVFRREAWERAGGYKARYCPDGAGSEDAALWSAICSIGYNAKQVTAEPLFNYSMQGGFVHDNKEYSEIDWLSMQPWAKDGLHPFASVATPKKHSHPVRQYDDPAISVIIPVGPGHEKEVANALDSLEMQSFRKWEAILVWDNTNADAHEKLLKSYPYTRWHWTGTNFGAGYCRNYGVNMARAPLLFFLDADDALADMHAFQKMLDAWNREEAIIYSDYYGKAIWDYDEALKHFGDKLVHYHKKSGTAVFRSETVNYDPNLAQRQPEHNPFNAGMPYYHWCLVSVLIPKAWHMAIGGFDEAMATWEDVDYHWRLARAGYCFHRIPDPLIMYAYHKGNRREASAVNDEESRQKHVAMIQYIKRKYEDLEIVGCNCGAKRQMPQINGATQAGGINDQDYVMIEFDFQGTQDEYARPLVSPTQQPDPLNPNRVLEYKGYGRRKGDKFLVHVLDQRARPDMFKLIPNEVKTPTLDTRPLEAPKALVAEKKRPGRRARVVG